MLGVQRFNDTRGVGDAVEEIGIAEGDVPRGADLTAMAAFYATVVNGLAIQARDAASSKVLQAVVEAAMAAWDGLTSKRRA